VHRSVRRSATDRGVLRVLAVTLTVFVGVYLPYTYISAVFSPAIGGHGGRIAVLLLVFGIAGTAGNLVAGKLADQFEPAAVVGAAALVLTGSFVAMLACRHSFAAAVVAVVVCGAASWSITVPQQHRIIAAAAPGAESLAVSLNSAVLYLAVSVSSVAGALALRLSGSGTLLLLLAAALATGAALLVRVLP
jgi:MFS transporter, DHA1 family, inner membrane transport protein